MEEKELCQSKYAMKIAPPQKKKEERNDRGKYLKKKIIDQRLYKDTNHKTSTQTVKIPNPLSPQGKKKCSLLILL